VSRRSRSSETITLLLQATRKTDSSTGSSRIYPADERIPSSEIRYPRRRAPSSEHRELRLSGMVNDVVGPGPLIAVELHSNGISATNRIFVFGTIIS
jgi:hypothetical protein